MTNDKKLVIIYVRGQTPLWSTMTIMVNAASNLVKRYPRAPVVWGGALAATTVILIGSDGTVKVVRKP